MKINYRQEIILCATEQYNYLAEDVLNLKAWKGKKISILEKVKSYKMFLELLSTTTELIKKFEKKR